MRVFLASTGSGMSKELRDKTVKICRPQEGNKYTFSKTAI